MSAKWFGGLSAVTPEFLSMISLNAAADEMTMTFFEPTLRL